MRLLPALLFALVCLFVQSCQLSPNAADIAADRARWTAMRDFTADRSIDDQELPVLNELFNAWDEKLKVDELRVAAVDTTWQDLVRVWGAAALTVFGGNLEAQAPLLFRFVDKNGNHLLELEELQALTPDTLTNPVFAAAVIATAVQLHARGHAGT